MAISLLFSSLFLVPIVAVIQGATTTWMPATTESPIADFYGRIVTNFEPPKDWKLVFDKPYSYAVSTEDLRLLTEQCSSKIMVGARYVYDQRLVVAASGPAAILQLETNWGTCGSDGYLRAAKFYNVWWYLIPNHSFGFAPSGLFMNNNHVDMLMDENSSYRLSWWLDRVSGGYRAGTQVNLETSNEYRMLIYCQ